MARVTVEDCLENVDNRFALVHIASQRTKQLFRGSQRLIVCKNRHVVTALREIADGLIDPESVQVIQAEIEAAEVFDSPLEDDDFAT